MLNDSSLFNINLCDPDSGFVEQPFPLIDQPSIPFPIFDLTQPQYPHGALMSHYIYMFIQQFGAKCPFITYSDTQERFSRGILSPLLSNCIAALAVRCAFPVHSSLTLFHVCTQIL